MMSRPEMAGQSLLSMEDNMKYYTTGVQNIDDKEFGLNFMHGGNSVGYVQTTDKNNAAKLLSHAERIFREINYFKEKFGLSVNLDIQMR
jgi:hypothetical protein